MAEVFTLLADDEDRPQHLQVVWVAGIPLAAIQSCRYNHVAVISASFVWNRGGKGDDPQVPSFHHKEFHCFSCRQVDLASVGLQVLEPFLQAEDWLLGPVCFEVLIRKRRQKGIVFLRYFIFVPHSPQSLFHLSSFIPIGHVF